MATKMFAEIISIVLGPIFWLPIIIVYSLQNSGLPPENIQLLRPLLFLFQCVIPFSLIMAAYKMKYISHWDIPLRKERFIPLAIYFVCHSISLTLLYFWGNEFIFKINLISLIIFCTLFSITLYWKISFHASISTIGSILLNFLFGWRLPWLYLTIPLVCWARYYLHRHTINQLLAGVSFSAVLMIIGLMLV